jgi:hypothetical protein
MEFSMGAFVVVGAIVLTLIALLPAVAILITVGYWGGKLNNGLETLKETLTEKVSEIRTEQRDTRQEVTSLGLRVSQVERIGCK